MIGTGTYDVRVMQVGGATPVLNLTPYATQIEWERVLNNHSFARVQLGEMDDQCCALLSKVRPYLHELWIRRNGKTVYNGVITQDVTGNVAFIQSLGFSHWLSVRFVRTLLNFDPAQGGLAAPVSTVVEAIVRSALSTADPNLLQYLDVVTCATPHERYINPLPAPKDTAWDDHLADMVGNYVDFTQHGRSLQFWCKDQCRYNLGHLNSRHFRNVPFALRNGELFQTAATVYNDKEDAAAVAAYSGGVHPTWGILVERKFLDNNVASNNSALYGAESHTRRDVPLSGENQASRLDLACEAPLDADRIVPGSCFTLSLNGCDRAEVPARVVSVSGSWQAGEDETVSLGYEERRAA